MEFLNRLSFLFVENGFAKAITNKDDSPIRSFTKESGPIWHVVLLADLDHVSFNEFKRLNIKYTRFYASIPLSKKPNNIFITNLLISKADCDDVTQFIEHIPPFSREFVSNIYWGINSTTGYITQNPACPTQMLNIKQLIESTTRGEPLRRARPLTQLSKPILTYAIMATNVFLFLLIASQMTLTTDVLVSLGALSPGHILNYGEYYRLITATFLHANFPHLLVKMFSLYILGTRVEKYYGSVYFAMIYVLSGVAASLASVAFTQMISVGASGAVFGIFGAGLALSYLTRRHLDGLPYQTIFTLILVNIGIGFALPGIDNFGHLGGLACGLLLGFLFTRRLQKDETSRRRTDHS